MTFNTKKADSKKKGDIIKKDEIIYRSSSFDNRMNYRYGINAKCVYMIENNTIEDAVWCSESFAKKMKSSYMDKIEISVNNNDILLNLYGDEEYKAFPDIGEEVNEKILTVRRRVNYEYSLFDLQNENLRKIIQGDTVFYSEGKVIDIDIYCNNQENIKEDASYNNQIIKYLKKQNNYFKTIRKSLRPIIKDEKATYSDDLAYLYRRAVDALDPKVVWKNEKSDFDNIIIIFKILRINELKVGSKISGKYGDKGIISKISPDDEMPVTEYGERVECIFNALGVVNRLGFWPI
jgi:DNA-directed RNA polymerase beta subunit